MEKEKLIELLSAAELSNADLEEIVALESTYPWFNLAHFLKLKALQQQDVDTRSALEKAAVFSSDRRHLYHWINNEPDLRTAATGLINKELEFIGEDEGSPGTANVEGDAFELDVDEIQALDDQLETGDEEDLKGVAVKEEVDMEEPDVEDEVALPVMDQIEEIGDEEPEVKESEELRDENKIEEMTPIIDTEPLLKESLRPAEGIGKENDTPNLIEQFIQNDPGVIQADKPTTLKGDAAAGSVEDNDSFITDTLAQIYIKQGLFAKAIYAYERLSLKYPEKSAYFAAQIEKIKNISNT